MSNSAIVNHKRRQLSWADLPSDLVFKISNLLEAREDLANFRAICMNFRTSTPAKPLQLMTHIPTEIMFYRYFFENTSDKCVLISGILIPTSIFLLRHHHNNSVACNDVSRLVYVEQMGSGLLRPLNPFTKRPLDSTLEILPGLESVEVSQGFNLMSEDGLRPALRSGKLCSPKVFIWDNDKGERYLFLLLKSRVLECVSLECGSGRYIAHNGKSRFDDVVYRDDLVIAVARNGKVYSIEPYSSDGDFITETAVLGEFDPSMEYQETPLMRKRLLYTSSCELFLIVRGTVSVYCKFQVFHMEANDVVWKSVPHLGDRVLFVTVDDCFFVSASDLQLSGLKGNCIVFPKDCFPDDDGCNYPDERLFQGVSENDAIGVYMYGEGENFASISSLCGYSDILRQPSCCVISGDGSASLRDPDTKKKKGVELQCFSNERSTKCIINDSESTALKYPSGHPELDSTADSQAQPQAKQPSEQINVPVQQPIGGPSRLFEQTLISVVEGQLREPTHPSIPPSALWGEYEPEDEDEDEEDSYGDASSSIHIQD